MIRTSTSVIRKLYSRVGTILGSVTYPDFWDEAVQAVGNIRVRLRPPTPVTFTPAGDEPTYAPDRTVIIRRHHRDPHGVCIEGCTPEEFEAIEECTFQPGAGYLRSLIG